jgi:hypothetical protein
MDLHFNIVLPLPFCSAKKKRLVSDPCGRSSPIKVGYAVAICVNGHSGDGPNCLGKAMARLPAGQRDIGTVSTGEITDIAGEAIQQLLTPHGTALHCTPPQPVSARYARCAEQTASGLHNCTDARTMVLGRLTDDA